MDFTSRCHSVAQAGDAGYPTRISGRSTAAREQTVRLSSQTAASLCGARALLRDTAALPRSSSRGGAPSRHRGRPVEHILPSREEEHDQDARLPRSSSAQPPLAVRALQDGRSAHSARSPSPSRLHGQGRSFRLLLPSPDQARGSPVLPLHRGKARSTSARRCRSASDQPHRWPRSSSPSFGTSVRWDFVWWYTSTTSWC